MIDYFIQSQLTVIVTSYMNYMVLIMILFTLPYLWEGLTYERHPREAIAKRNKEGMNNRKEK